MYKILKSTPNGIDELEMEQLEKAAGSTLSAPLPKNCTK